MNIDEIRNRAREAGAKADAATPGPLMYTKKDHDGHPAAIYQVSGSGEKWIAKCSIGDDDAIFFADARTSVPKMRDDILAMADEIKRLKRIEAAAITATTEKVLDDKWGDATHENLARTVYPTILERLRAALSKQEKTT